MRLSPTLAFSLVIASSAALPAYGQEMAEDDTLASLPLEDVVPEVRPQIPRAATQPTTQPEPEAQKEYLLDDPWGVRTWLIDHGITPGAGLVLEAGKNVSGGRSTRGSGVSELFNFSLSIDTEKLAGLKGGTAYLNFQQQQGRSATDEAGDIQGVFLTDADGRTQLSEAWYQQQLIKDKWLVKAGKIDANGDFAFAEYAAPFMNGGMAVAVANPLIPTYPDQALGIDTFFYPTEHLYFGAGLFDGSFARGVRTGENSPHTAWRSPEDAYAIAEAGATWKLGGTLSGRVKLGAWYQGASDLEKFTGGHASDTWGPYIALDQQLWRANPNDEKDDRGLAMFLVADHGDANLFDVENHVSAGLNWKGPMPSRDADVVGLGLSWAGLSDRAGFPHSSETAIETFYRLQLTPWISIQPDLQYILDPATTTSDHALVLALRVEMKF